MSQIVPYFQPIVSLQTLQIYGYEALGRRLRDGRPESLGPFFEDSTVSLEEHLGVDRILRERAIETFSLHKETASLFINLKPSWIYSQYNGNGSLYTLELLQQHHLPPERIVIEITEEEFSGDLGRLAEIVNIYRDAGCTIAVDDIGSGFSNLDRVALIQPRIMKMDLTMLKKAAIHDGYKALMRSFSTISTQIGASLLVEGIETKADLQYSLEVGARYAQGFLFSRAEADLQPSNRYETMLLEEIRLFHNKNYEKFEYLTRTEQLWNAKLATLIDYAKEVSDPDERVKRLILMLPAPCMRIYACRDDGFQVSSNFVRDTSGEWTQDPSFRGTNWSWRPYFISNILKMKLHNQGTMSHEYVDLDSANTICTFSYPTGDGMYLFMDLPLTESAV
ncbi:EAL domain-containing protein [Paenibacillus koleovorans]|uniref:EAL domain-containing protein n=1 Tax=Paenibacillus koleovorans TaxID=121608 RepID=UPI000FD7031E|nr:EAL domain-containing protein [Paenibacillus koleovorans]